MLKPASLRAALTAAVPHLQKNPQALHIYIEDGNVRSTMAGGLSFEYSYTLTATLTDYADHADLLIAPIIAWLRWQQPEMLLNPDLMRDGFAFEVDLLDHKKCDIRIKLKLTERVRVSQDQAAPPVNHTSLPAPGMLATITHLEEPALDPLAFVERWELYIGREKVQEWETRPFDAPTP